MSPGLKLNQEERVRRSCQFQEIYAKGRRLSGPHLIFYFMPNKLSHNRLGLSVSKRRFKLSVRRHYIQRRLREVYRLNKRRFLPGYDIVLNAQRFKEGEARLADIQKEVLFLARRAGLLKRDEPI